VQLGEAIPLERGHQRGVPPQKSLFYHYWLISMKQAADRHRLAAYHNKHCARAFQWYNIDDFERP